MKKSYIYGQKEPVKRSSTVPKGHKIPKIIPIVPETMKYYVGPGNNNHLIRKIMSTRNQWEESTDSKNICLSFKWQQSNKGYIYQNSTPKKPFRQVLNHFEYHMELSNKELLFKNILEYCELNKINAFEFLPLTFIVNTLDSNFEGQQKAFLDFFNEHTFQSPNSKEKSTLNIIKKPLLRGSIYIDKKIHTIYSKYEIKEPYTSLNTKSLWILKPTFYNRGNGVHVFNSINELENLMNKYIRGAPEQPGLVQACDLNSKNHSGLKTNSGSTWIIQSNSFVIQKYMERPLLFQGRKFDIRVWVLLTQDHRVYLFKQGYVRTSSMAYSAKEGDYNDLRIHLTNNAVQKHDQNYCKYEPGNQLSFKVLRGVIEKQNKSFDEFLTRMKELIKISMLAVRRRINRMERVSCFQIFGYDFMVDEVECKPWLIEVNTNPCLEESSPLLQQLLPRMIDDAFALTLDKIFPSTKTAYPYVVENEQNNENLWELMIDLKKA